jgi:hypothetical protein
MAGTVIKSSGMSEVFDKQKLADSLMRSGAPPEVAMDIADKVEKKISPLADTKTIYRMAKKYLRRYNKASGIKYSLKKALYALGPAGYHFEQYVARILRGHGYSAETNLMMEGFCVNHEVDVLGSREDEHFVIECKYHGTAGKPTDVKIALYVHSRFEDIRKACELKKGHGAKVHKGWLITNTRCTSDAIKYGECTGLMITSWKYPAAESLEKMIETKKLYPVTILPSASKRHLAALFKNEFILARDIAGMDESEFVEKSGIEADAAVAIKREADLICPCPPL